MLVHMILRQEVILITCCSEVKKIDVNVFVVKTITLISDHMCPFNPYPTAFPYGNGMVLHSYQQQESSTTKTVHKVINKGLKTYV